MTEKRKVTMDDALAAGDNVILNERLRDCLEALQWYADQGEDLNRYGMTSKLAEAQLRKDRGKLALEAIAKAKGE